MKYRTTQLLSIMKIVSWTIFIALCIKTGAILISFWVSLFGSGEASRNLYLGLDLSQLYQWNRMHYVMVLLSVLFVSGLKAYIFFWVTRIFSKIHLDQPFQFPVVDLISRISLLSLFTGLTALVADGYSEWLSRKEILIPIQWNAAEFLMMAGILFIVALVFQRGIDIQAENDLTI